jgi:methyltransferase
MIWTALILGYVTLARLIELAIARRNTAGLIKIGAIEYGADHYPWMVAMHLAWIIGLLVFAWGRPIEPVPLVIFGVLQIFRLWVFVTLGRRWTTRIFIIPGETLVAAGPYRWFRHPNYYVVIGEIAALPLSFGMIGFALLFSLLNAVMLFVRIRAEEAALKLV